MNVSFTYSSGLLRRYLAPLWRPALLMSALLLVAIAIELIGPQIMRSFIDTAERGGPASALANAALLFIAAALVGQAVRIGAAYMSEIVGWAATNRLRGDLLRHVLGLDLSFHKQHPPGALIERIDGDVTALANFFSQFVVALLGNLLLLIGVLALLWREDWRAGLGVSIYALVTLAALNTVQRVGSARWQAALQSEADLGGFLEERLRATEDIRANGAELHILRQLDTLLTSQLAVLLRAFLARTYIFITSQALFAVGFASGLALGAWLYTQGQATIGTAFLITVYVGLLARPLEGIRNQAEDMQQASAGLARVAALLGTQPVIREQPSAELPSGPLNVTFAGVTFSYGDELPAGGSQADPTTQPDHVLQDIAFDLPAGHTLGVLGRTGSGKTTLIRLLLRLYDPGAGGIRLGGHNLRDLALSDVRRRVGVVTQDVQIFGASARENITLFDRQIDDAAIWRVLEALGLRELIERLPQGLDTRLGSGGVGLSAGQAQLLACARVFLRDPGLIILDEASSRLDPASEALLERAIDRLLAGRSAVIIAHRLATLRRADSILVLDHGRVAEFGPRATLAADPHSRFAELIRLGEDASTYR
ncbi:MAG: ABC transporter ATP-binding protein [Roseiflexaceae bacterium]|nr:ABC transporter ATP-binding protein [Roseiflexaceae bacterium]